MTRNHLSGHHQATQEIHGRRPLGPCTWTLGETTLSWGRGGLSFSHPRLRGGGAMQEQRAPFQDGGHPGGSDGAVDAVSTQVLGGHHSSVSRRPGRGPSWRRVKKAVPSQCGWASPNPSGPEQNRRWREGRSAVCPAGSPPSRTLTSALLAPKLHIQAGKAQPPQVSSSQGRMAGRVHPHDRTSQFTS